MGQVCNETHIWHGSVRGSERGRVEASARVCERTSEEEEEEEKGMREEEVAEEASRGGHSCYLRYFSTY